ncbi:hypothetical protein B0H66DRAFT_542409 [Apodospora peruviana]|uniref:Rhodopsin domain-containing protein n=1 Tax=Apodospora peruviana TaxID=516989 RepID=A0AAE0IRY8_9PEZI|nr:hypothetical protein B0H66DRAFT_542409 [Apodospora peruviana]
MTQPMPTSLSDFPPEFVAYNDGPALTWTSIALTAVSFVIVGIRFAIRHRSGGMGLGYDDWLILCTLPLMLVFMVTAILAVQQGGVGRHLAVNMVIDPQRFETTNLYLYIAEYHYFTLVAVIKASILAMYYRIFPTRFMKHSVYIIGGSVVLWWVAIILVTIFQCQPVSKAYKPFMEGGTCLDKTQFFFGNSIPNILQDILIIALPMKEVWRLQVSRQQKVAIGGVFILGFAVVIIGCIRLKSLLDLVNDQSDFTQYIAVAWIWTMAEPVVGIIAACLPTLRPLLRLVLGRAFAGRSSKDANTPSNGGGGNGRTLITIGGGAVKGGLRGQYSTSKSKGSTSGGTRTIGSFEQLDDGDFGPDSPELWPRDYPATREVSVYGRGGRDPSVTSDEIPLDGIGVKRDVRWSIKKQTRDR